MQRKYLSTYYSKKGEVMFHRRYLRLTNSLPRAVQILLLQGRVGDHIKISHGELEFDIGTVTYVAPGKIGVTFEPYFRKRGFE